MGPLAMKRQLERVDECAFSLAKLVGPLIEKTVEPVRKALKDANLKPTEIQEVILVGGMTRMPKVTETVKNIFGRDPTKG